MCSIQLESLLNLVEMPWEGDRLLAIPSNEVEAGFQPGWRTISQRRSRALEALPLFCVSFCCNISFVKLLILICACCMFRKTAIKMFLRPFTLPRLMMVSSEVYSWDFPETCGLRCLICEHSRCKKNATWRCRGACHLTGPHYVKTYG